MSLLAAPAAAVSIGAAAGLLMMSSYIRRLPIKRASRVGYLLRSARRARQHFLAPLGDFSSLCKKKKKRKRENTFQLGRCGRSASPLKVAERRAECSGYRHRRLGRESFTVKAHYKSMPVPPPPPPPRLLFFGDLSFSSSSSSAGCAPWRTNSFAASRYCWRLCDAS